MLTDELMREVRRLEIYAKRRVDDLLTGEYHAAFKGQGIEFADVREYQPGDDVRMIDWNVTARAGKPFIKRHIEERQLTVMLLVDVSASTTFGTIGRTKSRLAAELAAVLAMVASRNNDRVGLLTFADDIRVFLPPRKGRSHLLRVIRECLGSEPGGGGLGLIAALELVRQVVRQHAVVFLISDFLMTEAEQAPLRRALSMASHRHEVIAASIEDPAEFDLPSVGLVRFIDPETGSARLVDTSSRRVRSHLAAAAAQHRAATDQLFRSVRVDRLSLSTKGSFGPELARYFRVRERRR